MGAGNKLGFKSKNRKSLFSCFFVMYFRKYFKGVDFNDIWWSLKKKRYLYRDKNITNILYARNLEEFYNIVNTYMDNILYKDMNGMGSEDNAEVM